MTVKMKSRSEKIGSGLGLVVGLVAFNALAPLFLEAKEGSDMTQMIGAMVSAMVCSEVGARIGKRLGAKESSASK